MWSLTLRRKTKISHLWINFKTWTCLLPHLFDILIRFRLRKMVLISNTKQAFLQIQIGTEHLDFLRFLWYNDIRTGLPPLILRFTRFVFGLRSSPFTLNATLKSHISQYLGQEKLRWIIEQFLQDLYVDNSTTSSNDVNGAFIFIKLQNFV